jgi:hypothetical protein
MICNVHQRTLPVSAADAAFLVDDLASPDDRLWPYDRWPAIRFDRPLQVGARGGHGPIRYAVSAYVPGRHIQFTFTGRDIDGFHEFEVIDGGDEHCVLRHTLMAHASGSLRIVFPLVIEPLHDACLRDILDRAEAATGGAAAQRPHSAAVRVRRAALGLLWPRRALTPRAG